MAEKNMIRMWDKTTQILIIFDGNQVIALEGQRNTGDHSSVTRLSFQNGTRLEIGNEPLRLAELIWPNMPDMPDDSEEASP